MLHLSKEVSKIFVLKNEIKGVALSFQKFSNFRRIATFMKNEFICNYSIECIFLTILKNSENSLTAFGMFDIIDSISYECFGRLYLYS